MTETEKLFEKMLNMEMSKEEVFGQCRNVAHKPMTNEEWLKSANTEQLADVFYMVFHNHADRVLNAFLDKHKDVFKKDMMEWLKQPHKDGKS